jgi:hypothetical protein
MWIKWYPMQWLHSTCRDEMSAAQRATFQDFVCLAAISPAPGSFKFLSYEALARALNTSPAIVKSTMEICVAKNRISLAEEKEGTICTIIKWPDYQAFGVGKSRPKCPINFNFEAEKWEGITENHRKAWAKAYPGVDIDPFLAHMGQWLVSNPARRKSNYCRALTNWLKKEQDKSRSFPGHDREVIRIKEMIERRKKEKAGGP